MIEQIKKLLFNQPLVTFAVLVVTSLLIAYFIMQKAMGLEPCPLCVLDRVAMTISLFGVFTVVLLRNIVFRVAGWIIIFAGLALGFASTIRHVWLERFPDSASCLFPSQEDSWLAFVLDAFAGTADCAEVPFRFLGVLTIAEMTLLLFCALTALAIVGAIKKRKSKE